MDKVFNIGSILSHKILRRLASIFAIIFLIQGSSNIRLIPVEWFLAAIGFPTDLLWIFIALLFGVLAVGFINAWFFLGRRWVNTAHAFLFLLSFWLGLLSYFIRALFYERYIGLAGYSQEVVLLNLFLFWFIILNLIVKIEDGNKEKNRVITKVYITEKTGLIFILFVITILIPQLFHLLGYSICGNITLSDHLFQELSDILLFFCMITVIFSIFGFLTFIMDRNFRVV